MHNKVYSMLGLAQKAGKLASGEDTCEFAIKGRKCFLVIVSVDASERTKKKFSDMCSYRTIDLREYGYKEEIGGFIGKNMRAVIAVKDQNFARKIKLLIDEESNTNGGEPIV